MNFIRFILKILRDSENWQNVLPKMAPNGMIQSKACISNPKTVKELSLVYLYISPPNLSMMLVSSNSADPLTFFLILLGFL